MWGDVDATPVLSQNQTGISDSQQQQDGWRPVSCRMADGVIQQVWVPPDHPGFNVEDTPTPIGEIPPSDQSNLLSGQDIPAEHAEHGGAPVLPPTNVFPSWVALHLKDLDSIMDL
jgi:hypothetical protein